MDENPLFAPSEYTRSSVERLKAQMNSLAREQQTFNATSEELKTAFDDLAAMRRLAKLVRRAQKVILRSLAKRAKYNKEEADTLAQVQQQVRNHNYDRMLDMMGEAHKASTAKISLTTEEIAELEGLIGDIRSLADKAAHFCQTCHQVESNLAPLTRLAREELGAEREEAIAESPLSSTSEATVKSEPQAAQQDPPGEQAQNDPPASTAKEDDQLTTIPSWGPKPPQ